MCNQRYDVGSMRDKCLLCPRLGKRVNQPVQTNSKEQQMQSEVLSWWRAVDEGFGLAWGLGAEVTDTLCFY